MSLAATPASFRLSLGRRTLWRFERLMVRRRVTLREGLSGCIADLPSLPREAAGYQLNAVPVSALADLQAAYPRLRLFVRQAYSRCYASLDRDFDDYLEGFSAKTRSTLRRKVRKLEPLDIRCFRAPDEMAAFHRDARMVSALSYQEQRLGAGLPDGEAALAQLRSRAARDAVLGWVLYVEGRPAAYLHAPAEDGALLYAHLGYDPEFAPLSPGTVLQFAAMRQLMAERRFRWFDFTEGDGQHKRLWATASIDCADLLLLRPTAANLLAGHLLGGFDKGVALAKSAARALKIERVVRKQLG